MLEKGEVNNALKQLIEDGKASQHRRIIVIAGSHAWGGNTAMSLVNQLPYDARLWVGSTEVLQKPADRLTVINFQQAKQWLGAEVDCLIINAWSGFDVNGFGALTGALKAGGVLFLITPPLSSWSHYPDPEHQRMVVYPQQIEDVTGRYLKRFALLIKDNPLLSFIEEQGGVRFQQGLVPALPSKGFGACKTAAQQQAVGAIINVAKGHRRRPFVLTADRGRGKSAALGIAAAALMEEGASRILVTAPALASTAILFKHCAEQLGVTDDQSGALVWNKQQLLFKAPDDLAEQHQICDLLLVDEAAAIAAPLLKKLLKSYPRIVFSSTIHGYEGTGRGFAIRFQLILNQLTPQWKSLHISEPVRWAANDPLEEFTFDALLLNALPADRAVFNQADWRQGTIEKINRDELVSNKILLNELFGLLVLAHYKTTPMDLRHLLDGSNISVYAFKVKNHVLATGLVAHEGGIDQPWVNDIWLGKRRVRGHLLPQSLSNHVGLPESIKLLGARIIRVAVHPEFQQQGIGRFLVSEIMTELRASGIDYIGSVFGATPQLLSFWQKEGFFPVRIGLKKEASSGAHSVMVIKPLTVQGTDILKEGRRQFARQLPYLLIEALNRLDSDIVLYLISNCDKQENANLTESDWADVYSFAYGQRLYESCIVSLKKLTWDMLANQQHDKALHDSDSALLIGKILQNRQWPDVAKQLNVVGRSQVTRCLRSIFARYLSKKIE
ncbi:MAG: GNAT family N-acetyltransferase [Endozoicomonas sp. (ex Botrylloides leachii)]|nr:GNAT family N-acetyltransferase [Endozoicomonas sp. (ex Botrylloides leachii)]